MVIEINNRTRSRIDLKLVKDLTADFLKVKKLSRTQVSLAFIGDQAMRRLNQRYRQKDYPTDILSFPEDENIRSENLGEIVIDYAQIKRQAKEFSHTPREELVFILVHGLLHLIGYEDDTEKARQKMIKMGEDFIKKYDKRKKAVKKF